MTTLTAAWSPEPAWWRNRVVRRFLGHRLAVMGLVMITLLSFACAFGPHLLPFDSLQIDLRARFAPQEPAWPDLQAQVARVRAAPGH